MMDRAGSSVRGRDDHERDVDRFEGENVILLVRPEEKHQIFFPRELLPDVEEGDILEVTATRGFITRIVKEVGKSVGSIG
jgi:hypothetical protein